MNYLFLKIFQILLVFFHHFQSFLKYSLPNYPKNSRTLFPEEQTTKLPKLPSLKTGKMAASIWRGTQLCPLIFPRAIRAKLSIQLLAPPTAQIFLSFPKIPLINTNQLPAEAVTVTAVMVGLKASNLTIWWKKEWHVVANLWGLKLIWKRNLKENFICFFDDIYDKKFGKFREKN